MAQNPFQDLIPQAQPAASTPQSAAPSAMDANNPFADLVPKPDVNQQIDPNYFNQPKKDVSIQNPGALALQEALKVPAAAIQGLASGGADIAQGMYDTPTYIAELLGRISPETAKKLYKKSKETTDFFRPAGGAPGDYFAQAAADNPLVYETVKIGTDLAGMAAGMKGVTPVGDAAQKGTQVLSSLLGGGEGVPILANMAGRAAGTSLVNAATVSPENKDMAAATGFFLSPAFDAAGYLIGRLGSSAATEGALQSTLDKYSKTNVDKAYDKIKSMPFTETDKSAVDSLGSKIIQFADDVTAQYGAEMGRKVEKIKNAVTYLDNADDFREVHRVFKQMGYASKNFSGENAPKVVSEAFFGLKKELASVINNAAIKNGLDDALQSAHSISNTAAGIGKAFKNYEGNEAFSFKTASTKLNQLINDNKTLPYMKDSVEVFKGLKKMTDVMAKSWKPGATPAILSGVTIGATVGGKAGYEAGGWQGAAVGGLLGTILGGYGGSALNHYMKTFANSPGGQEFFKALAKPGVTTKDVGNATKSVLLTGLDQYFGLRDQAQE